MKRRNLFIAILLLAISFNILHAYALDALDTHRCGISEYVHDFSTLDEHIDGDICHMHAAFHIDIILPESSIVLEDIYFSHTPPFFGKIYSYTPYNNFLKPPIFS